MADIERERDLVLNANEYAYVLDKTKGLISCVVGPYKMSLSTSDSLVVFNEKTKRFEEANIQQAIATFITAPENWYIELKNPAVGNKHPNVGTSNPLPELQIGKKINISGNTSFALYPGQMAKVIRGHRLHLNQYLLARVYDVESNLEASKEKNFDPNISIGDELDEIVMEDGQNKKDYTVGQLIVIKGTECSFYIPPTGIEVIPKSGEGNDYVRDAVTLERLEYCILKNEKGDKHYIHGPAVVYPKPDEVFITNLSAKSYKFRAIELSDISGIYLKVIQDYTEKDKDGNDVEYKAGQELFLTGKDTMIYYPRPEHAIIEYEGKIIHHAIAIPAGEGRYVLNRLTGDIKTIKGPLMYLPDARYEVIVKRKLTASQCNLWYPGNKAVLEYNTGISESDMTTASLSGEINGIGKLSKRGLPMRNSAAFSVAEPTACTAVLDQLDTGFLDFGKVSVEEGNSFNRKNTYTEPRTIVLDNAFDGVVSINVWTGYAVSIVSKTGKRRVVIGPQTVLLDYDESLESLSISSGKPKTTDHLIDTVYLRIDNNKVSDIISVQTSDFVNISVKVSYSVDFLKDYSEVWFSIENYIKYFTDKIRSLLKREVKKHTLEDFYANATDITTKVVLESDEEYPNPGMFFKENGMLIKDVEVLSVRIDDPQLNKLIEDHQFEIVKKSLELNRATKEISVIEELTEIEKEKSDLEYEAASHQLNNKVNLDKEKICRSGEIRRMEECENECAKNAERDLQKVLDEIHNSRLAREKADSDAQFDKMQRREEIKKQNRETYTTQLRGVIEAITPDLIAALKSSSNAELLKSIAKAMSPYAIARGDSVVNTVNTLLRGTSMENFFQAITDNVDVCEVGDADEAGEFKTEADD